MSDGVSIKIGSDVSDFEKGTKQVKGALGNLNKDVSKFSQVAGNAFASFLGNLSAQAVTAAFSALKNGFNSAISQVGEFITAANVQEDAVNALNTSLALTGKFSASASRDLQSFASQLQATSKFGDELILKNAALIQSFGGLSGEELKRATQAAADFAQATGKTFEETSKLIGRASIGQVESLKEVGVQIEKTGDVTKDFEATLRTIEGRFGGSTLAALNTFSGASTQTNNIIGDFKETLGAVITQKPAFIAAIKGVGDGFTFLIKQVNENKDAIDNFVNESVGLFIKGIGFAGDAVNLFIDGLGVLKTAFAAYEDLWLANIQGVTNFGAAIAETAVSVNKFFGFQTEGQKELAQSLRSSADIIQEIRKENDEALTSEIGRNEAIKESITGVTDKFQEEIAKRIELQKEESTFKNEENLLRISQEAEARQLASEEELAFKAQFNEQFKAQQLEFLGEATANQNIANLQKLDGEKKYNQALLELNKQREAAQRASFFGLVQYEKLTQRERIANLQSSLSQIATLSQSGSSELFAISKAAALANATIDGIAAVQKALASPPGPPFNFPIVAAVGAAQALNLAKIAGSKPPTGAFNGALVDRGSIFGDTQPFMLSKGEVVAPRQSFDEVVEGTARQRGFVQKDEANQESVNVNVNIQGDFIGEERFINDLVEKIRDAVQFRNANLGVS